MGKQNYQHREFAVPKLGEAIKKKNGASSRRLHKCIETLDAILEDQEPQEELQEERGEDSLDDIGQDD